MKAGWGILVSILALVPNPVFQAWAGAASATIWKEPNTGMTFVWVLGGCFQMGAAGKPTENPIHEVCVQRFWLARHEVTQKNYEQVMGSNPSYFKGDMLPVEQVNWDEANAFAVQLAKMSGRSIRLPSEAEWEYACRAGGQDDGYCGQGQVGDLAWFGGNSGTRTHPVGQKQANVWGLYDMSGNVWEWVQDCWHPDYAGAPADAGAWMGNGPCGQRIARGGGWLDSPPFLHAAYRSKFEPSSRFPYLGFRVLMTPDESIRR